MPLGITRIVWGLPTVSVRYPGKSGIPIYVALSLLLLSSIFYSYRATALITYSPKFRKTRCIAIGALSSLLLPVLVVGATYTFFIIAEGRSFASTSMVDLLIGFAFICLYDLLLVGMAKRRLVSPTYDKWPALNSALEDTFNALDILRCREEGEHEHDDAAEQLKESLSDIQVILGTGHLMAENQLVSELQVVMLGDEDHSGLELKTFDDVKRIVRSETPRAEELTLVQEAFQPVEKELRKLK